jgi:hypothetical protein
MAKVQIRQFFRVVTYLAYSQKESSGGIELLGFLAICGGVTISTRLRSAIELLFVR